RTDLYDDIHFVASGSGTANAGYFQNVGRTRRQGLELNAATRAGAWSLDLRYARVDATFRRSFAASSPHNSSADSNGAIVVRPGDRIPGIPRDSAKLRIEYEPVPIVALGANAVYTSGQYALGDENNQDRNGRLPAYAVLNLDGRYDLTPALRVFFVVSNVLDRRYQTLALLGANAFTGPGNTFGPAQGVAPAPEQFRAPAAPRAFWVGLRLSFGTSARTE
ncbi:MAG: TonB-dependent receptor, partial [Casimicrobiaceae bacterium]